MSSDSPRTAAGQALLRKRLAAREPTEIPDLLAAILAIEDEARRDGMKVADATPELAGFGHDGAASPAASEDALREDVLKFIRWSANVREDTIENIGVARELLHRIEQSDLADRDDPRCPEITPERLMEASAFFGAVITYQQARSILARLQQPISREDG